MEHHIALFDMLLKKCKNSPETDISFTEIKEMTDNIRQFDREGYELLFVLIKSYSMMEQQKGEIPYQGQRINENKMSDNDDRLCDIKFDIRNFAPMLRRILLEFSRLHLQEIQRKQTLLA
jgi:hypothetical protein